MSTYFWIFFVSINRTTSCAPLLVIPLCSFCCLLCLYPPVVTKCRYICTRQNNFALRTLQNLDSTFCTCWFLLIYKLSIVCVSTYFWIFYVSINRITSCAPLLVIPPYSFCCLFCLFLPTVTQCTLSSILST